MLILAYSLSSNKRSSVYGFHHNLGGLYIDETLLISLTVGTAYTCATDILVGKYCDISVCNLLVVVCVCSVGCILSSILCIFIEFILFSSLLDLYLNCAISIGGIPG